jgi:hypothetical protein
MYRNRPIAFNVCFQLQLAALHMDSHDLKMHATGDDHRRAAERKR